jgi:hypothetical protein
MLCEQANCSDYMLDFLDFIEKKLLRMDPNKRAGCDEVVAKFTELHRKCVEKPKYCTERLNVAPVRARTDLSTLCASALDFSPEMDKQIKRRSVLLTHTGPRESGSPNLDTQLHSKDSGKINSVDATPPGAGQSGSKVAGMDTVTEAHSPMQLSTETLPNTKLEPTVPSGSNDHGSESLQPQSPTRKILFEDKLHSQELRNSKHRDELLKMQEQLSDKRVENEDHGNLNQDNIVLPSPTISSPRLSSSISISRGNTGHGNSSTRSLDRPEPVALDHTSVGHNSTSKQALKFHGLDENSNLHDASVTDVTFSDGEASRINGVQTEGVVYHGPSRNNSQNGGIIYPSGPGGLNNSTHEKKSNSQDEDSGDKTIPKRNGFLRAFCCVYGSN